MYLAWRVLASLEDLVYPWYSYIYLGGELLLTLGVWGSHAARMFPSIRPIVRMDDMVEPLEHGNKVIQLLPYFVTSVTSLISAHAIRATDAQRF
jgi:hypothetical protein